MHGEHPESCTPLPTLCLALRAQRFAPKKPAGKGRGLESCPLPACFVLCFLFFYFWLSWIRPCRLLQQQQQRLGAGRADLFFFLGRVFAHNPAPEPRGGCGRGSPSPVEPHGEEEEEEEEKGLGPGPVPGPAAAVTQPRGELARFISNVAGTEPAWRGAHGATGTGENQDLTAC